MLLLNSIIHNKVNASACGWLSYDLLPDSTSQKTIVNPFHSSCCSTSLSLLLTEFAISSLPLAVTGVNPAFPKVCSLLFSAHG